MSCGHSSTKYHNMNRAGTYRGVEWCKRCGAIRYHHFEMINPTSWQKPATRFDLRKELIELRTLCVSAIGAAIGPNYPRWLSWGVLSWIRAHTCPCGRYKYDDGVHCATCGRSSTQ